MIVSVLFVSISGTREPMSKVRLEYRMKTIADTGGSNNEDVSPPLEKGSGTLLVNETSLERTQRAASFYN
jgi:hypothetical protein